MKNNNLGYKYFKKSYNVYLCVLGKQNDETKDAYKQMNDYKYMK